MATIAETTTVVRPNPLTAEIVEAMGTVGEERTIAVEIAATTAVVEMAIVVEVVARMYVGASHISISIRIGLSTNVSFAVQSRFGSRQQQASSRRGR